MYPIKHPPTRSEVTSFLEQSNAIESEFSNEALEDAEKAWAYLIKKDHVTDKEVLHVHKILMKRLRPDIAGKLRTCDVWIGGQFKMFKGTEILLYQLRNALTAIWMSFGLKGNLELIAKDCHVMFEDVHPFEDGNGRTGRILYNWHRLQLGLPIHIIHVGAEQREYYRWFGN